MYSVHMKQVTATDARKNWFRLLDEVAGGEVVVLERGAERIVLRREARKPAKVRIPSYAGLLRAPEAERADEWSWEWRAPGRLMPVGPAKPRAR